MTMALTTPPITTVASGRCTSAPTPVLNAIGTNPRLATSAVISTGRSRTSADSSTASARPSPRSRSWRMNVTSTMLFSTDTPDTAMNPTAAEIENGIPRSHNATTPPTLPNGTAVNTSSTSATPLYVTYNREKNTSS